MIKQFQTLDSNMFTCLAAVDRTVYQVILSLLLASIFAQVHAEEWVPVYEEPRHHLVFENEHALVLDVNLPPGYVSLYHQHVLDVLYVTIGGTTVYAQPLGGTRREAKVEVGDLRFSSDNHELPHIHQVGNIGETPFHVIAVGMKDKMVGMEHPIEGDPSGITKVMAKPHASVWRVYLKAGEKSGRHTHKLPFVEVFMNTARLKNQWGKTQHVEAGDFQWYPGDTTRQYVNAGDEDLEIILVQWH